jgi:sporulation protein YlmC with PRC-barrel domain
MVKVSSVSKTWQKDVFTDRGFYAGRVEDVECDLNRFKLRSLVIKAQKGSYLGDMLGGKRGLIIPFPMVQAIGDIIIIKHISAPAPEEQTDAAAPAPEPVSM